MTKWYSFLATKIKLSTPWKSLLARVAVDQAVFAPTFLTCFFTYQHVLAPSSSAIPLSSYLHQVCQIYQEPSNFCIDIT